MAELLPLFLNLTGRSVVLVGGGPVATSKLKQLTAAGARVHVVAPEISAEIRSQVAASSRARRQSDAPPHSSVTLEQRRFVPSDLDEAWLVVAAATPDVNRAVADAAEARRLFV